MRLKRPYRLRYFAQLTAIAVLFTIGILAMSCEPTDDNTHYCLTILVQLLILFGSWLYAAWLYFEWGLYDLNKRMKQFKRQ